MARSQARATAVSLRAPSAGTLAPTWKPSWAPHDSSSVISATTSSWSSVRSTLRRVLKTMRTTSQASIGECLAIFFIDQIFCASEATKNFVLIRGLHKNDVEWFLRKVLGRSTYCIVPRLFPYGSCQVIAAWSFIDNLPSFQYPINQPSICFKLIRGGDSKTKINPFKIYASKYVRY